MVSLPKRVNARYILEACNSAGCSESDAVYVSGTLEEAIGYVKASNTGERDVFGWTVALSGDGNTLAVGAYYEDSSTTGVGSIPNDDAADSGAVYVFVRDGNTWSQQAYVKASNTDADDKFGQSLALSADGNTLAVGALEDSNGTGVNSEPNNSAFMAGAVYVFTRSSNIWSQQAFVKASNTGPGDNFGQALALSGDGNTLAVGAPREGSSTNGINSTSNNDALSSGAVYVFTFGYQLPQIGRVWSQQAYIKPSNTGADDSFGYTLALSHDGKTLAVGSPEEDSATTGVNSAPNDLAENAGAAYVFSRSGSTWTQQAYIKAANTGINDQFGVSVALAGDGNTLAIGANQEKTASNGVNSLPDDNATDAGAVYVFNRSGGLWGQQAFLKASNTGNLDEFGISVALASDGNTLAVGAFKESSSSTGIDSLPNDDAQFSGAVYLFSRSSAAWSEQAYVKASNTGTSDRFGVSVALTEDGDTLAVGAQWEDSTTTGINSTPDELTPSSGAVYLY